MKFEKLDKPQQDAILRNNNRELLVSAAAGSGKTEVLIQRIVRRITEERVPVENFLVVTFTTATAVELKQKLSRALDEKIAENKDDSWLSLQRASISRANIGTVHSFCLKVIKENYEHPSVRLPKNLRVLDDRKRRELLTLSVNEAFEEEYSSENNEVFKSMLDIMTDFKGDEKAKRYVMNLLEYSLNNENPTEWLKNCTDNSLDCNARLYYDFLAEAAADTERFLVKTLDEYPNEKPEKTDGEDQLKLAEKLLCEYAKALKENDTAKAQKKAEEIALSINLRKFPETYNSNIQKRAVEYARDVTKELLMLGQQQLESEEIREILKETAKLAIVTAEKFEKHKKNAKAVDYGDMEHIVLRLFEDESVARIYKEKFRYILFDEYQDCNKLQSSIIGKISSESNYFMVGDVKQSIYGFRSAEPRLFLNKYNTYGRGEDDIYSVIELNKNFRSRRNILNASNKVFFATMKKSFCGMDYTKENALNYSDVIYPPSDDENTFENEPVRVTLVPGDKNYKGEFRAVAKRINEMVGKRLVLNNGEKPYRKMRYSDIAILTRDLKGHIDDIKTILLENGIPCIVEQKSNVNFAPEINLLISILRFTENPYNDVALLSVIHSYIFDVSDKELFALSDTKYTDRKELFEKIKAYIECAPDGDVLREKLISVEKKYNLWRDYAEYFSVSEFIERVMSEEAYIEYFTAFDNGQARRENIMHLTGLIRSQTEDYSGGLYEAVRMLDNLERDGMESDGIQSNVDSVRIMTVHKSKGLEFPAVFLVCASTHFKSKNDFILMHSDMGITAMNADTDGGCTISNKEYLLTKNLLDWETRKEEQRLLYVAMTRAREYLEIVGYASKSFLATRLVCQSPGEIMLSSNYVSWVLYALNSESASPANPQTPKETANGEIREYKVSGMDFKSRWQISIFEDDGESKPAVQEDYEAPQDNTAPEAPRQDSDLLRERLLYVYPHEAATTLNSKLSVSDIKKMKEKQSNTEGEYEDDEFRLQDTGKNAVGSQSSAKIGTLYHFFMQHATVKECYTRADFDSDRQRMIERRLITEKEAEILNPFRILPFFNSQIGKQIAQAKTVYREKSFSYLIRADEVYDGINTDERLLVQGVIDCMFCDKDGRYILIDYKTDRAERGEEQRLVQRHKLQMELYNKAISEILGIKITKMYIYSFSLGCFIPVE